MTNILFDAHKEITYHWCGKFISPDDNWIHMSRVLSDYEFMAVTQGVLYISDGTTDYEVNPGEYLIMPPTDHQYGTRAGSCSFYWLHFYYNHNLNDHVLDASDLSANVDKLAFPLQGKLISSERVIILMKQLMDSDRRYREPALNNALTTAIVAEVSASHKAVTSLARKQKKQQIYSDICDYISWHIAEPVKVSDISEYFGYNEKYLTTFFKAHGQIPIKQYILNAKADKAKAMLTETNIPISQIAYSLGWSDAHNFSNAFKSITGMSPSQWREIYNIHNVFPV